MGIPSFYRHLCRRYPRLIGGGAGRSAEWLCLDFNCAMYHVLRGMPPGSDATWEAEFRAAICAYLRELVTLARPTRGVYVSCDGVVCAAKRRQQRHRRFKGPWVSRMEASVRAAAVVHVDLDGLIVSSETGGAAAAKADVSWDPTALTPGTAFMAALGEDLKTTGRALASLTGLEVIVSDTDEPGEGEHKLLAAMRDRKPRSCCIYGLDADLILLALLLDAETGCDVTLLREAQEFEGGRGHYGSEAFRHLAIRDLGNLLVGVEGGPVGRGQRIRDYVAAMSLLGNDFLPRSLTRTVRDDGIPALLDVLRREVWSARRSVVCPTTGFLLREGLATVVRVWAATEEADMIRAVDAALRERGTRGRVTSDPVEEAVAAWQLTPARWCSLGRLKSVKTGGLLPTWRSVVREGWGWGWGWGAGASSADYLEGLAWVWDYYSGRAPVCQGWVYDRHLPPLWGDVLATLDVPGAATYLTPPAVRWPTNLPAWVHLLAVLPADSVLRLLAVEHQELLRSASWYWPTEWSLFDVGRSQMWECEPVLPLIPEAMLRRLVE